MAIISNEKVLAMGHGRSLGSHRHLHDVENRADLLAVRELATWPRSWRDRRGSAWSNHAESAGRNPNVVEQSSKRNAGNAGGRRTTQQQLARCEMPLASQRDVRPDGQDLAKRQLFKVI
jgi:hypothetical protein